MTTDNNQEIIDSFEKLDGSVIKLAQTILEVVSSHDVRRMKKITIRVNKLIDEIKEME